jgi:hypothetical protein
VNYDDDTFSVEQHLGPFLCDQRRAHCGTIEMSWIRRLRPKLNYQGTLLIPAKIPHFGPRAGR